MDQQRIIVEFSDGRSFENLVTQFAQRPEDEVLADLDRGIRLMDGRGFRPTGTRTFQEWTPMGWIRMDEAAVHTQAPKYIGGFRTSAAYLR